MNKYLSIVLFFGFNIAFSQISPNPKIDKKSTNDAFINKIEITSDYTIVSMQFVAKPAKERLKEYLEANPSLKAEIQRMSPMLGNMQLQQMMLQMGSSSNISIQPTAYLESENGLKFKFLKASNIPESPEVLVVEEGKDYFFKVYFEKLDAGIKKVNFVEASANKDASMTYWNFEGISINNPALEGFKKTETNEVEFILSGKVFDAETDKAIAAKITCKLEGEKVAFDSVQTSRTGYYEFLMKPKSYLYTITAEGYHIGEEAFDLSNFKNFKDFERNIYLEPIIKEPDLIKVEDTIASESTETITDEIERVDEKTLRLNNVYFATGKAEILEDSFEELMKLLNMMEANPEMKIRVDGHTDNLGDSHLNKILSLDRAKNVRDFLVNKGIAAERISIKGWGDTKPLENNINDASRQKNRRVEIVINEGSEDYD